MESQQNRLQTAIRTVCELMEEDYERGKAAERARIRGLVEGMKKQHGTGFSTATVKRKGYNKALSDVLTAIKGEEKPV